MALSPFDVLNSITNKSKKYSREEVYESGLNIQLLLSYLGSNQVTVYIADYLNKFYNMNIYDMYLFAYSSIPKFPNGTGINYIKLDKEEDSKDLDIIQDWYGCGLATAKMYLEISSKEDIQKIKEMTYIGGRKALR